MTETKPPNGSEELKFRLTAVKDCMERMVERVGDRERENAQDVLQQTTEQLRRLRESPGRTIGLQQIVERLETRAADMIMRRFRGSGPR
jgi:hypothetical protein